MRTRTIGIVAAVIAASQHTGDAFAPRKGAERALVASGRSPRQSRDTTWTAPASARVAIAALPGWQALWDHDTDVPLRLWGPSLAAPGAMADAAVAERAARAFLVAHVELLAPGARASDFVLVTNVVSNDVRSVAFEQRANGLVVVGGAIGFAFAHDRLVAANSTALPHVAARLPGGSLGAPTIASAAIGWLAQAGVATTVRAHGDRVVLPLVQHRGRGGPAIEYRVAETVSVESTGEPGRWDVWIDAADGAPLARRSTLAFASGVVQYNVPDRYPLSTRGGKPAPFATDTVNGAATTSALDGSVTWTAAGDASIAPGLVGTYVAITNKAGALVTATLTLAAGGTVMWDQSATEQADAQLDAFVYANTLKHFVLTRLNPNLAWAMRAIPVTVNEPQTCNAYSTGDDIHMFVAKPGMCENTGRISDVIYHEGGHSVHFNSIIPGVGQFDGALSEGLADTMAASITGDHGMGRGFLLTDAPLRDLAPAVKKRWPTDVTGEVHNDGEIIGETLWDLRTALEAKLGTQAGFDRFLRIYYGIMQRAADIPSSYHEALLADSTSGDLTQPTPNQCAIDAAFGAHGLADPTQTLGLTAPVRDNFTISFTVAPPVTTCPVAGVQGAVVAWNPRGATGGEVALVQAGNTWSASLPTQPDGTVVEYQVKITLADGSVYSYPDNRADPKYQFYVGAVTKLWCADFEAGAADWTHGATPAANDEWQVGAPKGVGGDPKTAHGGTNAFGIDLGLGGDGDGLYAAQTKQWAETPEIDLQGHTTVRLQYWRWLGSEDGAYDQSTIAANGTQVWRNFTSPGMPMNEINHVDKEWRFQDVDLSAQTATGKLKLRFELDSDPGLELGGWTLDDVCVVVIGAPQASCGNGVVDPGEQCDDGAQNGAAGDACSATCTLVAATTGGGCCDSGGSGSGPAALSVIALGLVLRRRRAHAR